MKYKNQKVEGVRSALCVVELANVTIGFRFQAIPSEEEFEKISPMPKPPMRLEVKTGLKSADVKDPGYVKAMDEWATRHTNWMILTSMKATEDFEWETVDLNDAGTWHNWMPELKEAGCTEQDIGRMVDAFKSAQGINDESIRLATARFLAQSQQVAAE